MPDPGQIHYGATITNALAFVCTVIRLDPESFDYPAWFPLVAQSLPIGSDVKLAGLIYSTILTIVAGHGTFESEHALLNGLALTLGLKERRWRNLG